MVRKASAHRVKGSHSVSGSDALGKQGFAVIKTTGKSEV
jgi:hypothetical protein